MATFGFISDIHANREALEAVLADTQAVGVDSLVCLGDIVGYGPDPGVCLDLVASACDVMIRGNHDEAVLRHEMHQEFNPKAWRSLEFTVEQLSPGHLMLIDSMRERTEVEGLSLAHASFGRRKYEYLYDAAAAEASIEAMPTNIGFVGHTHIPSVFVRRDGALGQDSSGARIEAYLVPPEVEVALPRNARIVLNPGSVGQPRDRNPDASWGVFDTDRWTFQVRRVEYDVDAVSRKMDELGLPDYHSLRLKAGV